jgi:hypothetical protein
LSGSTNRAKKQTRYNKQQPYLEDETAVGEAAYNPFISTNGSAASSGSYKVHVWTEEELEALRTELSALSGDKLLDRVVAFIARYLVLPSREALDALALWIAHTHAIEHFDSTPRLTLVSPEKQCGKTRTTELVEMLARETLSLVNASVAAIFRSIEKYHPTLIVDEADTIFLGKSSDSHEDLRGILNSGHRRGKSALRMVGTSKVENFETFCPVLLCSIRDLPDTIMDRSVVIRMRRRAKDEEVSKFLFREATPEGEVLGEVIGHWAQEAAERLSAIPALPVWLADRPADVWEPLLAVADAAGGQWPARARAAAHKLVKEQQGEDDTWGVMLLRDIRTAWANLPAEKSTHVYTESLLHALTEDDESPWRTIQKGYELDARGLAWRLKPYGVTSKNVRIGNNVRKGYVWADFDDAWKRYLPDL